MKTIATIMAAIALFTSLSLCANAQEDTTPNQPAPSIKFSLLDIQGLVIGKIFKIDANYAAAHSIPVLAPFSVLVPTSDDIALYVEDGSVAGSTLIKVSFATKDDQLIENVQFVPMTIGPGSLVERTEALARLLTKQSYPMAIADYPKNKFIGWREIKVAGMDGIEVLGEYVDPTWGHMYLRLVGYINPDSDKSVFAVSNIVAGKTPITDADDFPRTRSGVVIGKLEFLQ